MLARRPQPACSRNASRVDGDEMQRLIVSGCRWPAPGDSDLDTEHLADEPTVRYALRIRNSCLVAAEFADAGITAIVIDSVIGKGFEALTEVLKGRPVNFVVVRPSVALLRPRGARRLPEEAAELVACYGGSNHPEVAAFAAASKQQKTAGRSMSSRQ